VETESEMGDWTEGRTPYDILELSHDATDEQIRKVCLMAATFARSMTAQRGIMKLTSWATLHARTKAFKTMALRKHPDKNKNNPAAGLYCNLSDGCH